MWEAPQVPNPKRMGKNSSCSAHKVSRSINTMIARKHLLLILFLFVAPAENWATARAQVVPPPLRIHIPFEAGWDGMVETLEKNEFELLRQDRGQGFILSSFREYSSGLLTESHISKIGEKPKLIDGDWVRVRYRYEILVELIADRETVVTVYANIEALKREYLGKETWIEIQTIGKLEETLLTQFGQHLFGGTFSLQKPKKGFWERDPTYAPHPYERIPRIVGPERSP